MLQRRSDRAKCDGSERVVCVVLCRVVAADAADDASSTAVSFAADAARRSGRFSVHKQQRLLPLGWSLVIRNVILLPRAKNCNLDLTRLPYGPGLAACTGSPGRSTVVTQGRSPPKEPYDAVHCVQSTLPNETNELCSSRRKQARKMASVSPIGFCTRVLSWRTGLGD